MTAIVRRDSQVERPQLASRAENQTFPLADIGVRLVAAKGQLGSGVHRRETRRLLTAKKSA